MSFGVIVTDRLALPARGRATHTDRLFLAMQAAAGSTTKAVECRSILDFEAEYGARTGLTVGAWDYADVFFREGGKRLVCGRYDTEYTDAFDLFTPRLGPGQLAVIGTDPSETVYADMQTHCLISDGPSQTNRLALRDVTGGAGSEPTVGEMETLADSAPENDDRGATFGPWVIVPGPSGVYGAGSRHVPASAVVAALCARADEDGNPNRAPGGPDYPLHYVRGWETTITDVDRAGLFAHGVNAFDDTDDVLCLGGFQTNIPQNDDNPFWQFNCARARMYLKERARARGQKFRFRNIDGQGKLAGHLKSDIAEEFFALWNVDGLYGLTPAEAYYIEVGEVVNTISEIAQGHLRAVAQVRLSLHTKAVFVDLVTIPITSQVGS